MLRQVVVSQAVIRGASPWRVHAVVSRRCARCRDEPTMQGVLDTEAIRGMGVPTLRQAKAWLAHAQASLDDACLMPRRRMPCRGDLADPSRSECCPSKTCCYPLPPSPCTEARHAHAEDSQGVACPC